MVHSISSVMLDPTGGNTPVAIKGITDVIVVCGDQQIPLGVGGYLDIGILDTMNFIKCDVSTICIGECASMAAVLLSSGTKGKRFVLPNSMVLIHQPLGGAQGQQTEIAIVADFMLKTRKRLNKILSENTGQSIEKIQLDTERDNYMTAEEAKEYGLVDEIIYHHGAMPGEKKSE